MSKSDFYSLDKILETKSQYNMIIGERSNGKTYSVIDKILLNWWEKGEQGAYIRRWQEDFKGKRPLTLFEGHVENGRISEITGGEWNTIKYQSGMWYLAKRDEDIGSLVTQNEPFMWAFALSDMEHDKSTSYPRVTIIAFDEFLTRKYYLPDEFVTLMNVLSTIIRRRNNVTIFMMANTVNKYAPYFKEMGLRHVSEMKQGKIDVYSYGSSSLKVAVEYCSESKKGSKDSDVYFAFDNPALSMITGGSWEIDIYPHKPRKFKRKEIMFTFFIEFNDSLLQCECVVQEDCTFLYIHEKSTPIKDENKDIIFTERHDPRPNFFRNIRKGDHKIIDKIGWYFRNEKVYYQDNEVGEIVRNYLNYCNQSR